MPADMPQRFDHGQRQPALEAPLEPGAAPLLPVARRRAAGFDEREVLRVGHRSAGNPERRDGYLVRPFFVVENKTVRRLCAEQSCLPLEFDIFM